MTVTQRDASETLTRHGLRLSLTRLAGTHAEELFGREGSLSLTQSLPSTLVRFNTRRCWAPRDHLERVPRTFDTRRSLPGRERARVGIMILATVAILAPGFEPIAGVLADEAAGPVTPNRSAGRQASSTAVTPSR